MQEEKQPQLKRSMTPGQMEMIAIGGTIGSGYLWGQRQQLSGQVHPSC